MIKRRFMTEEEKTNILEDFSRGLNTVQLAEKYGRNNTSIGKLLKRSGLSARNIKSKMTEEQVFEAYNLYSEQLYTTEKLGVIYEVDANTIANSFRRFGLKVRPNGNIPEASNERFFETIDSEAKAYFLGFVMCDGSVVNDKGHYALHIELQERDKEILEVFAKQVGLPKSRVKTYTRTDKEEPLTTVKISINSDIMCQDLIDKGVFRRKVGNKSIPRDVPDNLLRHTVRGMIDADGSIHRENRTIRLYGGGTMTDDVSAYLHKTLKLASKPNVIRSDNHTPFMYSSRFDFDTITKHLYKDANFFLKRKNPFISKLSNSPTGE